MKKRIIFGTIISFSLLITLFSCNSNEKVEQGISIVSIEKTKSEDYIDTYTIKFSDDTTTEFTINNGEIVSSGVGVEKIECTDSNDNLDTYTITLTNGNSTIFTIPSRYKDNEGYITKELNIYREKDIVDKKFEVRFYNNTPNIPYVDIYSYYKEFFGKEYNLEKDGYLYTYNANSSYIKFDIKNDVFYSTGLDAFSSNNYLISSTSKTYLSGLDYNISPKTENIIDLKKYNIDLHGDTKAYVPLTFLSSFSGGGSLYNITYNTKDIYVMDYGNGLNNAEAHNIGYYGESYINPISDSTKQRPNDLIEYNYGQLCFNFDNLRGYTSQLVFGDNNLITLGLDGLLETYYPKIKELLLDKNKDNYFAGYNLLFKGLYDGGHTGSLVGVNSSLDLNSLDQEYKDLISKYENRRNIKNEKTYIIEAKNNLGINPDNNGFYYKYDETTKTALIGFDTFTVDYNSWNSFYKEKKDPSEAPVLTDTYAFIRQSFYRAKEDGAQNLVLDLTTNGGGNTSALAGIYGLFNGGIAYLSMGNTFNKFRETEKIGVDINLDGKFDDKDVTLANSFNFNYAVLTSEIAFSCGNYLPSMLKELGVKIIGERSGGGSCAISICPTAEGLIYVKSNWHVLSNRSGENIDSGVPLDYEIDLVDGNTLDYSRFFTFNFLEYFNSL